MRRDPGEEGDRKVPRFLAHSLLMVGLFAFPAGVRGLLFLHLMLRNRSIWAKNGVGSSIRLGMRIGNLRFWAKKRGCDLETSINMQKLYEKI